jgi:hypothetical protein
MGYLTFVCSIVLITALIANNCGELLVLPTLRRNPVGGYDITHNGFMSAERQQILFYVVHTSDGYTVWETTPDAMFERTKRDPTLNARLDRTPFKTRAEAERRCIELTAAATRRPSH